MANRKTNSNKSYIKDNAELSLLCLPSFLKVIIFSYVPFLWLTIAFQNFIPRKGIFGSTFVGFKNFEVLFTSPDTMTMIRNAIAINALCIIFSTIVSVLLGLFLYEITSKLLLKFSQTVIIFPYFVSWPLIAIIVSSLIGDQTGMIADLYSKITGAELNAYSSPWVWWPILTFLYVWKTSGLSAVTYYAVLIGTDKSIYEAAKIDGASRFRTMFQISLPMLKLMIILNVIMSCANILRIDFNMIYYVTQDKSALLETTNVIETFMYRALRGSGASYEVTTAIGLVQAAVGFVLTMIVNKVCRKIGGTSLF